MSRDDEYTVSGTRLNADRFLSLKEKLPTDVDIIRRLLVWKETGEREPYILFLNQEESLNFEKEFRQKILGPWVRKSIYIEGTEFKIVTIQTT